MKKKVISIILISMLLIIITGCSIYFSVFYKPKEEEPLVPVGLAEVTDEYRTAGYEVDTELPVFIMNTKSDFAKECTGLSRYAKKSVDEYMCRYLSYYLEIPEGTIYYGDYVQGSFKDNENFPSFKIKVNMPDGNDLYVNCIFNNSTERYVFESELSE